MNDKPSLRQSQHRADDDSTHNTQSGPSEPVCSDCASNHPTFCRLKRKYYQSHDDDDDDDDDDDEASSSYSYHSQTDEEEDYYHAIACDKKPVRRNKPSNKIAQVPHLSDKRQRFDHINKKMRALRQLIPNCNKVDTASMLDDAIDYLKALQLQAQIMSTGCCMSQMMLHMRMQQMLAMPLPHFSPLTSEMALLNYNQTQVPTSLALNQGTGFPMVGLQGQVLPPMSMTLLSPHSTPFPGVSYAQSVPLGKLHTVVERIQSQLLP